MGDARQTPGLTVQLRPAKSLAARLEGDLVVDEAANCLVVRKAGRHIDVAWPPGFSVAVRDGSIVLIDSSGQMVAELGDTVVLGGGHVSPSAAHATSCTGSERVFAASSVHLLSA
ncbi:hypothetical protein [Kribbella shirazensis]|uniref:Uncharacterized protein n=1 Tax=Kribbella shirazensis TaxID=1105143 RepID=A0A7X6A4M0_9ACTN|nr:hypothetical protein [Kribbella shirazensis]NIK61083.1 hypothetical protein [Kribbella shirazensis]